MKDVTVVARVAVTPQFHQLRCPPITAAALAEGGECLKLSMSYISNLTHLYPVLPIFAEISALI
jgi:hypothetical protein